MSLNLFCLPISTTINVHLQLHTRLFPVVFHTVLLLAIVLHSVPVAEYRCFRPFTWIINFQTCNGIMSWSLNPLFFDLAPVLSKKPSKISFFPWQEHLSLMVVPYVFSQFFSLKLLKVPFPTHCLGFENPITGSPKWI